MHTRPPISPEHDVRESSMRALRLAGTLAGSSGECPEGTLSAADPVLPYGELPRARWWGCPVRRVPLAHIRSAQTELLDVAVQVLGNYDVSG